ncbi:MAG: right-handed parallel beta-helix repeat-containing protein [Myxococcota bacterium]
MALAACVVTACTARSGFTDDPTGVLASPPGWGGNGLAVAALRLSGTLTVAVGTPLTLTVEAVDSTSARVTGYLGTVVLTSTDTTATFAPATTFTAADAGRREIAAAVTFGTPGPQVVTASDGTFSTDLDVTVLPAPATTALYRSVGPGRTAPFLVAGSVDIVGTMATFSHGVLLDVGVGDVVQYDSDDDGVVDALAVIHGRRDNSTYDVYDAAGLAPVSTVAPDTDYAVLRAYTSLADALAGDENVGIDASLRDFDTWSGGRDAVANHEQWTFALHAGDVDTAPVSTAGWTTNATYCLRLYAPTAATDVGRSQRHDGVWTALGYRLAAAGNDGAMSLQTGCVQLEGLQISNNGTSGTGAAINSTADTLVVRDVILGSAGGVHGNLAAGVVVQGGANVTVANAMVYGFDHGIAVRALDPGAQVLLYANTVVDAAASGIVLETGGATGVTFGLKNNLVHNSGTADFSLAGATSIDAAGNVSSDATSPQVSLRGRVVQFVDPSADNYHLALADTGAADLGEDLSADTSLALTHDIAGRRRVGAWDVGAVERPVVIYRSVGPGNTTPLATSGGTDTLTISATTATFSAPLPARIGVGDVIEYAASGFGAVDTVAIIYGRTSSTSYTVTGVRGESAVPTAPAPTNIWRVLRAYTSLADVKNRNVNTGVEPALRGFEPAAAPDLLENNEVWRIACYGDAVDTELVDLNGWTTGRYNDLTIYTPYLAAQVGTSQRHTGVWTPAAYRLVVGPSIYGAAIYNGGVLHVRYEGLQIERSVEMATDPACGISTGAAGAEMHVSQSIFRAAGTSFGGADDVGVLFAGLPSNQLRAYVWNNIFSGLGRGVAAEWRGVGIDGVIANNTVVDCEIGIALDDAPGFIDMRLANNLVQGAGTGYVLSTSGSTAANVSQDASSPNAAFRNRTAQFVAALSGDYHLAPGDVAATDAGVDLSADLDLPFADDIDGAARATPWDVGADDR